jgi:hypothetical protein
MARLMGLRACPPALSFDGRGRPSLHKIPTLDGGGPLAPQLLLGDFELSVQFSQGCFQHGAMLRV